MSDRQQPYRSREGLSGRPTFSIKSRPEPKEDDRSPLFLSFLSHSLAPTHSFPHFPQRPRSAEAHDEKRTPALLQLLFDPRYLHFWMCCSNCTGILFICLHSGRVVRGVQVQLQGCSKQARSMVYKSSWELLATGLLFLASKRARSSKAVPVAVSDGGECGSAGWGELFDSMPVYVSSVCWS